MDFLEENLKYTQSRQRSSSLYHEYIARRHGRTPPGHRAAIAADRRRFSYFHPNFTLYDMQLPIDSLNMRCFTPDGQYLVCFCNDQSSILLYGFTGPTYQEIPGICTFHQYFQLAKHIILQQSPYLALCQDFCLFTSDRKFLIVVAYGSSTNTRSSVNGGNSDTEFTDTIPTNYIFYIVEIHTGNVLGYYSIYQDIIPVHRHLGVSLYDRTFSILTLQSQEIHILEITKRGTFRFKHKLGSSLYPQDGKRPLLNTMVFENGYNQRQQLMALERLYSMEGSWMSARDYELAFAMTDEVQRIMDSSEEMSDIPTSENDVERIPTSPFTPFQQALLSWLYRKKVSRRDIQSMEWFYKYFEYYLNHKLWRIQLLNQRTLLIKMVPSKDIFNMGQSSDFRNHDIFYILFDMTEGSVKDIFSEDDPEVEQLILTDDALRERQYQYEFQSSSSNTPGSSNTARMAFNRQIYIWQETTNGSYPSAMRKLACYLPCPPPRQPESVYFDLTLYRYDRKLILALDKSQVSLNVIKFYSAETNEFKFELPTTATPMQEDATTLNTSEYTVILPHPFLPFIITKRKGTSGRVITNFHVYKQ